MDRYEIDYSELVCELDVINKIPHEISKLNETDRLVLISVKNRYLSQVQNLIKFIKLIDKIETDERSEFSGDIYIYFDSFQTLFRSYLEAFAKFASCLYDKSRLIIVLQDSLFRILDIISNLDEEIDCINRQITQDEEANKYLENNKILLTNDKDNLEIQLTSKYNEYFSKSLTFCDVTSELKTIRKTKPHKTPISDNVQEKISDIYYILGGDSFIDYHSGFATLYPKLCMFAHHSVFAYANIEEDYRTNYNFYKELLLESIQTVHILLEKFQKDI